MRVKGNREIVLFVVKFTEKAEIINTKVFATLFTKSETKNFYYLYPSKKQKGDQRVALTGISEKYTAQNMKNENRVFANY